LITVFSRTSREKAEVRVEGSVGVQDEEEGEEVTLLPSTSRYGSCGDRTGGKEAAGKLLLTAVE